MTSEVTFSFLYSVRDYFNYQHVCPAIIFHFQIVKNFVHFQIVKNFVIFLVLKFWVFNEQDGITHCKQKIETLYSHSCCVNS